MISRQVLARTDNAEDLDAVRKHLVHDPVPLFEDSSQVFGLELWDLPAGAWKVGNLIRTSDQCGLQALAAGTDEHATLCAAIAWTSAVASGSQMTIKTPGQGAFGVHQT